MELCVEGGGVGCGDEGLFVDAFDGAVLDHFGVVEVEGHGAGDGGDHAGFAAVGVGDGELVGFDFFVGGAAFFGGHGGHAGLVGAGGGAGALAALIRS